MGCSLSAGAFGCLSAWAFGGGVSEHKKSGGGIYIAATILISFIYNGKEEKNAANHLADRSKTRRKQTAALVDAYLAENPPANTDRGQITQRYAGAYVAAAAQQSRFSSFATASAKG